MNKLPCALLLSVFLLAACTGDPVDTDDTPVSDTADSGGAESVSAPGEEFAGYALTVNGVRLLPGVTVGVDALLGTPDDTLEAPSCVHEGNDIVFCYAGLEIVTSPSDAGNYITTITLTSDEIETEEGIAIGASLEDVTAVYGDYDDAKSSPDFGRYVFTKSATTLTIFITDNTVTSVSYSIED